MTNMEKPQEEMSLEITDEEQQQSMLSRLNTLRKGGQFCDVTLEVGGKCIRAHKAVLACTSVFLYELFSETEGEKGENFFKLDYDYESFNLLVAYAYSSRLIVPESKVREVYKLATMLKMNNAAEACSKFLAEHLQPSNCLGIRSFANSNSDSSLTEMTDSFIQNNIDSVVNNSKEIGQLPRIQVDVIGVGEEELKGGTERNLCKLVLEWIEKSVDEGTELRSLKENAVVLYMNSDNTFYDCKDWQSDSETYGDIIQDYKKRAKNIKRKAKGKDGCTATPAKNKDKSGPRSPPGMTPRHLRGSTEQLALVEKEWRVIATKMVGEKSCLCVAMVDDDLMTISIKFRPPPVAVETPANGDGATNGHSNGHISPRGSPPSASFDKSCSLTILTPMSSSRCGVGTAILNGKLWALGGYDREECLATVEAYDILENKWTAMKSMRSPRGRFDVTKVDGRLFACGGSNGHDDLQTAECYDVDEDKWTMLPNLSGPRSSTGVANIDDHIYVVGGSRWAASIADCEVLVPGSTSWTKLAPLNTARSETGVCAMRGLVIAVGGREGWHCLNTVEAYDPKENKWMFLPHMNTPRRGAGVVAFKDHLYVIGGSDGQNALATTEIFDFTTQTWSFGPVLSTPRVNVGVCILKERVFAVGGFNGKAFLDSIEYLSSEDDAEWCSFVPMDVKKSDESFCCS